LIVEEKNIGEIKYKTLLALKNLKHFPFKKTTTTNKQTSKNASTTTISPVRGTVTKQG